jgi:5-formyltetrahydrofolate cyclo-ligase
MAVPRLATPKPFHLLDHHALEAPIDTAATSTGAAEAAPTVAPDEMQPIDLIICGSVAIGRHDGVRIGKGAGYSDLEVALLADASLVTTDTTIATTIHQHQLIDDALPHAAHDFPVNLAATPHELLDFGTRREPLPGIIEAHLRPDQLHRIPALSRPVRRDAGPGSSCR